MPLLLFINNAYYLILVLITRWTVKVRVTNKSDIRTWSNSRGEGKLFSMDLMDESGEIRATAFNQECDKFYHMIEVLRNVKDSISNTKHLFISSQTKYSIFLKLLLRQPTNSIQALKMTMK